MFPVGGTLIQQEPRLGHKQFLLGPSLNTKVKTEAVSFCEMPLYILPGLSQRPMLQLSVKLSHP